jgi:hypothetical protein
MLYTDAPVYFRGRFSWNRTCDRRIVGARSRAPHNCQHFHPAEFRLNYIDASWHKESSSIVGLAHNIINEYYDMECMNTTSHAASATSRPTTHYPLQLQIRLLNQESGCTSLHGRISSSSSSSSPLF